MPLGQSLDNLELSKPNLSSVLPSSKAGPLRSI